MFASLIVVLPTEHEGGTLVLRHNERESRFDSATAIQDTEEAGSIAYVAFFSDVEHSVEPVRSGYRVTLTYNLYYDRAKVGSLDGPETQSMQAYESALIAEMLACLDNPEFLPEGGLIGFGLRHEYPGIAPDELKGSDAVLFKICENLSLEPSLRIVYDTDGNSCLLCDRYCLPSDYTHYEYDRMEDWILSQGKNYILADDESEIDENYAYVHWITPMTAENIQREEEPYAAYGNEVSLDYVYSSLCLVVKIGKPGARTM